MNALFRIIFALFIALVAAGYVAAWFMHPFFMVGVHVFFWIVIQRSEPT